MLWRRPRSCDFLIVGLGNPGRSYTQTRHNLGFMVCDYLHTVWKGTRYRSRFKGMLSTCRPVEGRTVGLLKPMTYVNLSGLSVSEAVNHLKLSRDRILIILDDVNLPVGRIRIRRRGSAGGHKGLQSVLESLGTDEVPRLRIGIGPLPPGEDLVSYVLSPFAGGELEILQRTFPVIEHGLAELLRSGFERASALLNL